MKTPVRAFALPAALAIGAIACGSPQPAAPCFVVDTNQELRAKDAAKTIADLEARIRLSPEDEELRQPKSLADVKKMLRRDAVYVFANGAAFARAQGSVEGRFAEATLELLLGESQLVASEVLSAQEAWLGGDLRMARAALASEGSAPSTDRGRMLAQLIRVVEEGNKIADALGAVAPKHLARGAEVIRTLEKEAPNDVRTSLLLAEYHRLRGEWTEFDAAMTKAEAGDKQTPALCYLRAMEQLERTRKREAGVSKMRECLTAYPKFVRGQAALVLMARGPRDGMRELEKLKKMNEDHYLVMLTEPTLAADQELLRMQGRMDGGGSRPQAPGPDKTPAAR